MKTLYKLPIAALALIVLAGVAPDSEARKGKKKTSVEEDPYAEYVWPPPPDTARIKLETVISGRADVEAESRLKKALIGASPQSLYDHLGKPYAVAFDSHGRILVTDSATFALLRFDREASRMDVMGTQGRVKLRHPLGLHVSASDVAYVADIGWKQIIAFDDEGDLKALYGKPEEMENPTDSVLSPDAKKLFVADSKAHKIVVYDAATAELLTSFGVHGESEGELNFPTSLAFDPEGLLYVVDQANARVQTFTAEGEYVDLFGNRGVGFGQFVRPKDVAVDEVGFIYVTDFAFNNFQIFDADFSLLTFVGTGGTRPGEFLGASGIAVRGAEIAVVDQLGHRLQVFRFLLDKDQ